MQKTVLFTDSDRRRLGQLLTSTRVGTVPPWSMPDELEWQLETSVAVRPESIPDDVVTMNSTVRLINEHSDAELVCTVVYPEDVDLIDDGVSVLDPIGSSLIGTEAGDVVECEDREHRGSWRIAEIVYQPERAGKFEF